MMEIVLAIGAGAFLITAELNDLGNDYMMVNGYTLKQAHLQAPASMRVVSTIMGVSALVLSIW